MPEIDLSDFRSPRAAERIAFNRDRQKFVAMIYRVITELGLVNEIEHLTVHGPINNRAELYRNAPEDWPSRRLQLDIYWHRYLDANLLRHEFGHEADRRNPAMLYDPLIERRWRAKRDTALEIICNLSLDARLGSGGLGRECRLIEFREAFGTERDPIFEAAWQSPPMTWPAMEELACLLRRLVPKPIPPASLEKRPRTRRARPAASQQD
jgi:hypothetical protein